MRIKLYDDDAEDDDTGDYDADDDDDYADDDGDDDDDYHLAMEQSFDKSVGSVESR